MNANHAVSMALPYHIITMLFEGCDFNDVAGNAYHKVFSLIADSCRLYKCDDEHAKHCKRIKRLLRGLTNEVILAGGQKSRHVYVPFFAFQRLMIQLQENGLWCEAENLPFWDVLCSYTDILELNDRNTAPMDDHRVLRSIDKLVAAMAKWLQAPERKLFMRDATPWDTVADISGLEAKIAKILADLEIDLTAIAQHEDEEHDN